MQAPQASARPVSRALAEENRWRAQRYGTDGTYIDLETREAKPFKSKGLGEGRRAHAESGQLLARTFYGNGQYLSAARVLTESGAEDLGGGSSCGTDPGSSPRAWAIAGTSTALT